MKKINILKNAILFTGFLLTTQVYAQISSTVYSEVRDIIKNDFLVNDDSEGNLSQRQPSQITMNASGVFVIVWCDERNGDFDIFYQRYNAAGEKQGNNTRVNDDAGEAEQRDPSIGIDNNGNFVVTWGDMRNGYFDVYMQRFSADGTPLGSNIMVNDDQGDYDNYNNLPILGMSPAGDFVIAWNDTRDNNDYDVWAQRYASDGSPQGVNFKVNEEGETEWGLIRPGAGMDQNGNFVICWADDRMNGNANVFAQRYQADGTAIGSNFYVNDTTQTIGTPQMRPQMAMNKNGEFVIGWEDFRNGMTGYPDIYAQRYDAAGSPLGTNFRVTDQVEEREPGDVNVTISESGNIIFTWHDTHNDFFGDAFAQRFDASGNAVGSNFLVDDMSGYGIQEYPSVATRSNNDFIFTFFDDHGNNDIIGIRYNWEGSVLGSSFAVNDDTGANFQQSPSIDMNPDGKFVIAWMDNRNDYANDIFIQRYDASGNSLGLNVMVNDDDDNFVQNWWPDVAISNNGDFAVTWFDTRTNNSPDIYAQRYSSDGTALGVNFLVNDDDGAYQSLPVIAMDAAGNFVIAWQDHREGSNDIYAQRFSSDGAALGANFKVNDVDSPDQTLPNITMNSSGSFVIVWADERIYRRRIFAQIYNADGTPNGNNINCSEFTEPKYQDKCAVSMDDNGNFVVAWEDERHSTTNYDCRDIYARVFDANGNPDGPEFRVNDNDNISDQINPSVTMAPGGGQFVIGWTDFRSENKNPDFMAQKYVNGEAYGENVLINTPDWFPYMHQRTTIHSFASNNNMIGYAWMDNRRHKHWDIYAKLTDLGLVGIEQQVAGNDFTMYPNPAKDQLDIRGLSSEAKDVTIALYNLNGRKLLEKQIPKGTETVQIDVSSLQSGLYFCRISTDKYSVTKKVIIQK